MKTDKSNRAIPKPGDVVIDLPCLNVTVVRKPNQVTSTNSQKA